MLIVIDYLCRLLYAKAAGRLDYMVKLAERLLRRNPSRSDYLESVGYLSVYFCRRYRACGSLCFLS